MTFLLYFYTDILEISRCSSRCAAGGACSRCGNGPDHGRDSRANEHTLGPFAAVFVVGAIPLGVITVLTFTVPDLDESGRVLWAYATYIGFGILYTVVTIPYSALTASLTNDYQERTQLSTWRMAFAFAGAGVVTVGVPALVPLFETEALGYQVVMSLFALVATGLLVLAFFPPKKS